MSRRRELVAGGIHTISAIREDFLSSPRPRSNRDDETSARESRIRDAYEQLLVVLYGIPEIDGTPSLMSNTEHMQNLREREGTN